MKHLNYANVLAHIIMITTSKNVKIVKIYAILAKIQNLAILANKMQ
jgi:hypothetical protein